MSRSVLAACLASFCISARVTDAVQHSAEGASMIPSLAQDASMALDAVILGEKSSAPQDESSAHARMHTLQYSFKLEENKVYI